MNIISKPLNKDQFINETTKKDLIILHHTVSSNADSPVNWWNQTSERVAAPYVISKDGAIYETFDDSKWAWHLGGHINKIHNMRSIGIEIVNEGQLIKNGDRFFWLDGKAKYTGPVYTHSVEWRGCKYFAAYTDEQLNAVTELVKFLMSKYSIKNDVLTNFSFNEKNYTFKGIASHHNFRSDKLDVSPAFNINKLKESLQ